MATFQELKATLDKGVIQNFYIFTGEEREVLNKYIKRIDPKAVEASSFNSIVNKLGQGTLFRREVTYVLRNDKEVMETDVNKLVKLTGPNTLILVYDKIDDRKKFFKSVKGFIYTFDKFTEEQLAQTVINNLSDEKFNLGVEPGAAEMIARYCNNEVARIELECHKLNHAEGKITKELVSDLIQAPLEDRIFDMVEAFATKKQKLALKLYTDLLQKNESHVKILSIIYTTFRNVFLVSSYSNLDNATVAGKTGLTFYQVNNARKLLGAFPLERIARLLKEMNDVEYEIKTGRADINQRVEFLLLSVF